MAEKEAPETRITNVARELAVSPEWLRELERKGEIPPAQRDKNGHRRYRPEDVERLRGFFYPSNGEEGSEGAA